MYVPSMDEQTPVMDERTLVILSDVHANLEALVSVAADIRARYPDSAVVSLGDVVGYGPQPDECVDLIREMGADSVMGNHEQGLINIIYLQRFNQPAQDALRFTREHLSKENFQWCISRPKALVRDGMRFVHGMPPDSVRTYLWTYAERMADAFVLFSERICFVGHTHEVHCYALAGGTAEEKKLPEAGLVLDPSARYLINVGAVGQPRGADSRAAYLAYDSGSGRLTCHRVEYDIDKTAQLIRASGLHRAFADRLYGTP